MQQPHGYKSQAINQALPNKTYFVCDKPQPLSAKPHSLPALPTPSVPIISLRLCNTPYYYYKSHLINQACPLRHPAHDEPHSLNAKPHPSP